MMNYSLLALRAMLPLLLISRALTSEAWFMPYETDEHTLVLLHFDGDGAMERNFGVLGGEAMLVGNARRGHGRFGDGIVFDGSKGSVRFPMHERLKFKRNQPFTVECWMRPETDAQVSIFSIATRFYVKICVGRRMVSFGYRAASFPIRWYPCAGVPLKRNKWQHIAITHDEYRVVRVYFNGELIATIEHADEGDFARATDVHIGSHDGWTAFFVGAIDEVRISDTVRQFQPLLTHRYYLRGERVQLGTAINKLPEQVVAVRVTWRDATKRLHRRTIARNELQAGLLSAEQLPAQLVPLRIAFLDVNGRILSQVSARIAFAGNRMDALRKKLRALKQIHDQYADDASVMARSKVLRLYLLRVHELLKMRQLEEAEARLTAAQYVARMIDSGETAYRAMLRKFIRAHPPPDSVRITMSWRANEMASLAFKWAKRLGANELVGASESTPEGMRTWKRRGYRTVMLGALPMRYGSWLRDHPKDAQFGYWVTEPVEARDSQVRVRLIATKWGGESITTIFDPKRYWKVVDVSANEVVPPHQWSYNEDANVVTIINARRGHRYRVYFLMQTHVGDPQRPRFAEAGLQALDKWLSKFKGVLDTYWFDEIAYAYPGPTPQGAWDWEGYVWSAHPDNQSAFTRETGIAFDPRWLVMPPRSIEVVPHRNYLRWMEWVQGKIKGWMRRAMDIPHRYGMRAWLYWGDCHVGMEPFLSSITDGNVDEIDKPASDAVTARALVSFPGVVFRRFRVHWLHSHQVGVPRMSAVLHREWTSAKRGLLMKPIRGIYWMPFQNVAFSGEACVREDLIETISEINDEFRLIAERLADQPAWVHDITVYVIHSWGKVYSWRPWGSPILTHLTDAPVRVKFISYAEVETKGMPADADVAFLYGLPNSSWSGGHWWSSGKVAKALVQFVHDGGGLVALQAPSYYEVPEPHWALSDLLGVRGEGTLGYKLQTVDASMLAYTGREAPQQVNSSTAWLTKTVTGEKHWLSSELPVHILNMRETVNIAISSPATQMLYALRTRSGDTTPAVIARDVGNGRIVYICGWSNEYAFTRLIRRAILWVAHREDALKRLWVDNADNVFIYAYPTRRLLVLFSINESRVKAKVHFDPSIFNATKCRWLRLIDVVTQEELFKGTPKQLSDGVTIMLPPRCVRVLKITHSVEG